MKPRHDKRQAGDRMAELQDRVCALEAELEAARGGLPAADDDLATPPEGSPRHEWISRRMQQVLQLADDEAQQKRAEAELHAATVLERAQAQARGLIEAAQATAEELLRAAMLRCEEELRVARAEASRLLESATGQAARPPDAEHHGEPPGRELASGDREHLNSA
jgi:cell division septum initiation protein DivIVA